jgi:hypothetical protein
MPTKILTVKLILQTLNVGAQRQNVVAVAIEFGGWPLIISGAGAGGAFALNELATLRDFSTDRDHDHVLPPSPPDGSARLGVNDLQVIFGRKCRPEYSQ